MITMMRRMSGLCVGFLVASALTFAGADEKTKEEEAKEHADAKKILAAAKVDLLTAVKTAVPKVPGGKVFQAEAAGMTKPKFQVHFLVGEKLMEVEIDAITGKVIEVEDDEDPDALKDAKVALPKTKVTLAQAIEAALKGKPNAKAFEASIEMDGDKPEVVVEFFDGDKIMVATIDPDSGKVLNVEEEKE